MEIENENTFRRSLAGEMNLFLGSGFSVLASDQEGDPLPTGVQLKRELVKKFSVHAFAHLDLPQLCTVIEHSRKADLAAYLRSRFSVSTFDPRYHVLGRMKIKTVFTTNIDGLLFKVYETSETYYVNDLDARGPAYADRQAIDVIYLHGCVLHERQHLRFSSADLASSFASDPDKWHYLAQRLDLSPTLFWGYSMRDPGALQTMSSVVSRGRRRQDKWITLLPSEADEANVSYFHALDFQIINADASEMLDYLASTLPSRAGMVPSGTSASTKSLFPEEALPELGSVAVRPILEFYLGAPPRWCDIFSGQVHRTAHFDGVRNSINSGKNTLIIGAPACGKTTLLMQVASAMGYGGHTLVLEFLTAEKARLIENRLRGAKALVLVDNFTDSLDGFVQLATCPGVQVVGADRDYSFEIVSHRLDRSQYEILDVTELSPADTQECLAAIPQSVRSSTYTPMDLGPGLQPSLFEIMESNIAGPTLRIRFGHVLKQLGKQDERLRDLLLMTSYVYKCRTPVSMDMLIAFMRGVTSTYRQIYSMIDQLGRMVAEYVGPLAATDQDHFIPRSAIVGGAVLEAAENSLIAGVLLRFHRNISKYRICRYDVFRRSCYDNDLMVRVFPDWEEGRRFYQDAYLREESPYILQQGALYLSKKRRFTEAFNMIDRAITQSGGHIWSIRNSHAIILFRANIEHYPDPVARATLKQSMQILTDCHRSDRRKPYHIMIFADQALKLSRLFGDNETRDYLLLAESWLREEASRSPWHRGVQRMLPSVRRALS